MSAAFTTVLLLAASLAAGPDGGPRFPFGWTPATTFQDLAGLHQICRDPRPGGGVVCFLAPSAERQADFDALHPALVSVDYAPKGDARVLAEVTLHAEGLQDCDDLLDAFHAAVASALDQYGKPQRIRKGAKYGSRHCGDYRRESAVQWVGEYPGWRVRVDAFYAKGAYTVYRSVVNLANEALDRAARSRDETRPVSGTKHRKR